jgi:hypothetical protein
MIPVRIEVRLVPCTGTGHSPKRPASHHSWLRSIPNLTSARLSEHRQFVNNRAYPPISILKLTLGNSRLVIVNKPHDLDAKTLRLLRSLRVLTRCCRSIRRVD